MIVLFCRYSGYCAWRGVLDFSGKENSEAIIGIKSVYPELGNCLYFHLGSGTHSVLYELPKKKLNWIWYVHQPEPEVKVHPHSHPIFKFTRLLLLSSRKHCRPFTSEK